MLLAILAKTVTGTHESNEQNTSNGGAGLKGCRERPCNSPDSEGLAKLSFSVQLLACGGSAAPGSKRLSCQSPIEHGTRKTAPNRP